VVCVGIPLKRLTRTELYDFLKTEKFWSYTRWAVKALAAEGKLDEAIQLAEASRDPWTSDTDLGRLDPAVNRSPAHPEAPR
jgi:hypothetical protein